MCSEINHLSKFYFDAHLCSYTPISDPDSKGYFDLLIKVLVWSTNLCTYLSISNFVLLSKTSICFDILQVYPEGKMSQHFASLKPGDVVEVKGYVMYHYL